MQKHKKLLSVATIFLAALSLAGCAKTKQEAPAANNKAPIKNMTVTVNSKDVQKYTKLAAKNYNSAYIKIDTRRAGKKAARQVVITKYSKPSNLIYRKMSVKSKKSKQVETFWANNKRTAAVVNKGNWGLARGNGRKSIKDAQASVKQAVNAFSQKNIAKNVQAQSRNNIMTLTYSGMTQDGSSSEATMVINNNTHELVSYKMKRANDQSSFTTVIKDINDLDDLKAPSNVKQLL